MNINDTPDLRDVKVGEDGLIYRINEDGTLELSKTDDDNEELLQED
jgi:hypothetical protein